MNAAALMTADQYRAQAVAMLDLADETLSTSTSADRLRFAERLTECAQVYALLAISAQAAENREDVPF